MGEFFAALMKYPFLQYALLAGALSGVACGIVGTYVVVRRISYIAGGIAHCVLGGLGAASYLREVHGMTWVSPLMGALTAAFIAAFIIGFVSIRAKQREDTVIGALWAVGMAVGIMFITATPGYNQDLMGYLFGNILIIAPRDIWLLAGLDVAVALAGVLFYNQFLTVCFDEEFSRLRGISVETYFMILLVLTALTVVLLVSVVGIVLVIALLTLPAATASFFSNRLWGIMAIATVLSISFTTLGIAVSYTPDIPAGATIILIAGGAYLLTAGVTTIKGFGSRNNGN